MSKFYVQGVYSIPGDNGEPVVNPYISDKVQRQTNCILFLYLYSRRGLNIYKDTKPYLSVFLKN